MPGRSIHAVPQLLAFGLQRNRQASLARLKPAERALIRRMRRWNADGNILGVGIGAKRKGGRRASPRSSIIFFVARKVPHRKLPPSARIPALLAVPDLRRRVRTDVVEMGRVAQLQKPAIRPGCDAAHHTLAHGTVTAVVTPRTGAAKPLFLSCAHCFAPIGSSTPFIESPPDLTTGVTRLVGALAAVVPLKPGGTASNSVDAALALADLSLVSGMRNVIPGLGPITSIGVYAPGELEARGLRELVCAGSQSGQIRGELIAENTATLLVDDVGNIYLFTEVTAYMPSRAPLAGDSGMPVMLRTAAGLQLVGMHIGAGTVAGTPYRAAFFVPMANVLRHFDIRLP